jgi:hypothetical protein
VPVFKCSKCGCVENTAVSHYWTREKGTPPLCSECDPAIGKWHGRFEKRSAEGLVEDGRGFLISREEAALKEQVERGVQNVKNIEHIGIENMARHYFTMGWNWGIAWERKEREEKKE